MLGGSGGIRIITTVAQVFLNQFVKKLDASTSVQSTRVHHQVSFHGQFLSNVNLPNVIRTVVLSQFGGISQYASENAPLFLWNFTIFVISSPSWLKSNPF